ncbi:MAG TPA: glycosyltransferase family 39 protein, partial [Candidatus Sulfopaludibacter sp.]|nr:glycosyltransferase family 39 protein [Candidatus Sulfopaludibacter sp.]
MKRAWCAVALLSLACLLIRAARVGMAGDYVDPVSRITAQDEALYAHSAIHMARNGQWLTPMFMGRLALYKPPLLDWLAGLSARIAGVSRLALRFPVALAGSVALGLIFLWAAELRTWQTGVCAAALLASSHLWHVLGSMCMTDGLLAACCIAALYCLFADPWLESKAALWGFSAAVAGAILTKSIAGLLPLGVLGLYWLAAPARYKPAFRRVCLAGGLSLALAAPWFVYQMLAHGRWFFAEHFGVEILGYGAGAPPQTGGERHLLFYALRMALIDPVLTAASLAALPAFFGALRRRSAGATLLLCWVAVALASIFGWQYRNAAYLLPLIPALAILGSSYGPVAQMKPAWWVLALAAAAVVWKAALPGAPWGVSFQSGTVQPVAPLVAGYCQLGRGNELILVGMDDDLYASILPLARVRYAIEGSVPVEGPYVMSFARLGIVLTAAQFNDLEKWTPVFRDRLRQAGLDSGAPIGTLVMAQSPADFAAMVHAHPASDFLLPNRYRQEVAPAADATHLFRSAAPGHFLLLSRDRKRA